MSAAGDQEKNCKTYRSFDDTAMAATPRLRLTFGPSNGPNRTTRFNHCRPETRDTAAIARTAVISNACTRVAHLLVNLRTSLQSRQVRQTKSTDRITFGPRALLVVLGGHEAFIVCVVRSKDPVITCPRKKGKALGGFHEMRILVSQLRYEQALNRAASDSPDRVIPHCVHELPARVIEAGNLIELVTGAYPKLDHLRGSIVDSTKNIKVRTKHGSTAVPPVGIGINVVTIRVCEGIFPLVFLGVIDLNRLKGALVVVVCTEAADGVNPFVRIDCSAAAVPTRWHLRQFSPCAVSRRPLYSGFPSPPAAEHVYSLSILNVERPCLHPEQPHGLDARYQEHTKELSPGTT